MPSSSFSTMIEILFMKRNFILPILLLTTALATGCRSSRVESLAVNAPFDQSLAELPKLTIGTRGELLSYCGFNASYNNDWRIPNWVAYELTKEETDGPHKRKNHRFKPDTNVAKSAENSDYSNSGYSRGHMAPASDMKWDNCAMNSCFYLTNICPQDREMNAGCWQILENRCRTWAKKEGSLLIVCGPIVTDDSKRIGRNQVTVPSGFFKAVVQKRPNGYAGIGFLFPNKEPHLPIECFATTIDEVERITGFDLFHNLPDSTEKRIEAELNYQAWGLEVPTERWHATFP